jgi:prevent-host-death family protein
MAERKATVTSLRENLAKYLDETKEGPLRVMKHGETAAYLVNAREFEELIDKLEDLLDIIEATKILEEVAKDPSMLIDAEEVFKELGI